MPDLALFRTQPAVSKGRTRSKYRPDEFKALLDDGRVAVYHRVIKQDYTDCRFSAGLVSDLPPEDVYLMLERPFQKEPYILSIRRDEAEAIVHVLSGALWSLHIKELTEKDGK